MNDSIARTALRRALGGLPKPATIAAVGAAALLIGVVAVAPVNDVYRLDALPGGTIGDEQHFAMASVATVVDTAIADRDALASDLSPARMAAELAASHDQRAWAQLVLFYGGWDITEDKVAAITQWMRAENSPDSWWLRNNPLNNGWYTDTGNFLGSYATLDEAAYYAADSIRNRGLYPGIAAAFGESGITTSSVASAIINSGWAAGYYGGGSHWRSNEVPMVVAPADAWGI